MGSLEVAAYLFSEIAKMGPTAYMVMDPATLENLRQSWLKLKTRELAETAQPSEA